MRTRYDVKVPMSDGVRLSADVYLPDAEGRYPVVLIRTPYSNNERPIVMDAEFYVEHGYVFVAQDCRGKFDSEGEWYPHRHEARDGDETLTWCGTQPWSSGRVGMIGGSYSGAVQWYAATTGNPYLKCIVPLVSFSDLFFDHGLRRTGIFQTYFLEWSAMMAGRAFFEVERGRREDALWQVPLVSLDEYLGFDLPYWKDFVRHEAYDDFWRALSIREKHGAIDVPALGLGGWHSPWELQGVLTNFVGMVQGARSAAVRRQQKLIIGPWTHQVNQSQRVGEFDFGAGALIALNGLTLRWLDRWLKGEENGIEDEPPVRLFVMGENVWREEAGWPLEHAQPVRYYLHSGGRANSLLGDGLLSPLPPPGDEPPDRYTYNPQRPVVSLIDDEKVEESLFADHRPVERRDDVLVYTTEPLGDDVRVIGPVTVNLCAATSARDTDFVAMLLDISPDGWAKPLTWGIARGRYLAGLSDPQLLEPHRVYEWQIDLWATGNVFKKQHRIRVEVSSSFFPFFGRNHNTGNPIAEDTDFMTADQVIHHSRRYPSHILLPIVPG